MEKKQQINTNHVFLCVFWGIGLFFESFWMVFSSWLLGEACLLGVMFETFGRLLIQSPVLSKSWCLRCFFCFAAVRVS